jgi:hypothetical protein
MVSSITFFLLSLASQALAVPLAYDDGFYHSTSTRAAAPTQPPATTSTPPVVAITAPVHVAAVAASPSAQASAASGAGLTGGITVSSTVNYNEFSGDGTAGSGWPTMDKWINFEQM